MVVPDIMAKEELMLSLQECHMLSTIITTEFQNSHRNKNVQTLRRD